MDIESHLRLMIAEDSSAVVSASFAKVALDKFNELRTENARLQSIVDEANAQEPVAVMGNNGRTQAKWEFADVDSFLKCCRSNTPLYANPIPAQQSPSEQVDGFPFIQWSKEKEFFESMQQSPAVAVPDDWNAQCTCGHRWYAVMPTENCPSCNPSPRITEQELREIAVSVFGYVGIGNFTAAFNSWFNDMGGRALLDKLNKVNHETN